MNIVSPRMGEILVDEKEYKRLKKDFSRLKETVEVLSDKKTVRKLSDALKRTSSGEILAEEDVL